LCRTILLHQRAPSAVPLNRGRGNSSRSQGGAASLGDKDDGSVTRPGRIGNGDFAICAVDSNARYVLGGGFTVNPGAGCAEGEIRRTIGGVFTDESLERGGKPHALGHASADGVVLVSRQRNRRQDG